MLWINLSYLILFISATGIGFAGLTILEKVCGQHREYTTGNTAKNATPHTMSHVAKTSISHAPMISLLLGIVALTVYAQVVSLFHAVTYQFAFAALAVGVLCIALCHRRIWSEWKAVIKDIPVYEWILLLIFWAFIFLLTSLYPKQYDNYLYQAQMLRYYEEYGVVRGMANISTRLGFNNSIYALMSLYSFKGIYGFSLHTVNSALCLFFGAYSIHGLCHFHKHKMHAADGLKAAMLAYICFNCELLNCIGTDIPAVGIALMLMILTAEQLEEENKEYFAYAILALICVFDATIKLSMATMVLLALYPAYLLLKNKKWKQILIFILSGVVILLPFLIRNVLISGWLVYPFAGLDFFHVPWKISRETVEYEATLVYGWARIQTSDVYGTMALSLREWWPVWFRGLLLRYRLLVMANLFLLVFELLQFVFGVLKKKQELTKWALLKLTTAVGFLYWMLSAPDVRFGWCYLVALPLLFYPTSVFYGRLARIRLGKVAVFQFAFFLLCILSVGYAYHKENCTEVLKTSVVGRINIKPFYIYQGDFSQMDVVEYDINGMTFYYSPSSDMTGYYGFPGTTDKALLDNLGFLGDNFKDGVYRKQ